MVWESLDYFWVNSATNQQRQVAVLFSRNSWISEQMLLSYGISEEKAWYMVNDIPTTSVTTPIQRLSIHINIHK